MIELGVIRYYVYAIAPIQFLLLIVTYRMIKKGWESLPPMKWRMISFLLGLLAILVASLMELPFLVSKSVLNFLALGIAVGPIEEFSKLLPAKIYREEKWMLWKKTIGTAFFFGLIEGSLYALILLVVGQPLLALYRIFLIAFHVALTFITATHYLVRRSWTGYLRASLYHSLYDLPVLLYSADYTGSLLKPLMALGILMIALAVIDVLKTYPLISELVPGNEEKREIPELPADFPEELTSWP